MKRIVLASAVCALGFATSGCAVNSAPNSRPPASESDATIKIVHRVYQVPQKDNDQAMTDEKSDRVTVDYPERRTAIKSKTEMAPPWLLTTLKVLADLELEALVAQH